MPWTPPNTSKTYPIRPLNRGMVTDSVSHHLPDGSFITERNMYGGTIGPKRYPGSTVYAGGDTFLFNPHSYFTLWRSDGNQTNVLLCDHAVYTVDPGVGFTEVVWEYTTGTITVSGLTVTGSGTGFDTNDVKKGDVLYVVSGGTTYYGVIDNVMSATGIVLLSSNIPDGVGYAYSIHRVPCPYVNPFADYVNVGDYTLIATGKNGRPLIRLSATAMAYWMDTTAKYPDATHPVYPSVVSYFDDRVWIGEIDEYTDGRRVNRIRWSKLTDYTDFNVATNYVDLPYTSARLIKLLPLNDMLIAYFKDTIFVGRRTNYPTLPVQFFQVETGGLGISSIKGVISFLGSHVFITKLGPYIFDGQSLQPMPCPILDNFKNDNVNAEYNRIVFDEERSLLLFCLANSNNLLYRQYVYDVIGKVWSFLDIETNMIDSPMVTNRVTIDGFPGAYEDPTAHFPIDSFGDSDDRRTLIMENIQQLYKVTDGSLLRFGTEPIVCVLETPDMDFNISDDNKAFYRFGLKIDYRVQLGTPLTFILEGSNNRGRRWKRLSTLVIRAGEDEGYSNFRLLGSHARFRLTSADQVPSYNITEYTVKVRMAGNDEALGSQQP